MKITKIIVSLTTAILSCLTTLAAQITSEQADSILHSYLRGHWGEEMGHDYEYFIYYRIFVNKNPSDTVRISFPSFPNDDIVAINSFLYAIEPFMDPNVNVGGHSRWFLIDKHSGTLSISENTRSFTFSDNWYSSQEWILKDCLFKEEPPKTLNKTDADRFLIDTLQQLLDTEHPYAYTLYSYPDTSTFGFSWYYRESSSNEINFTFVDYMSPPPANLYLYFLLMEDSTGIQCFYITIWKPTNESPIYISCQSLYDDYIETWCIPLDLWSYPITYIHLHQVGNESAPETTSAMQAGRLFPNVPNPFSSVTRIRYSLPESCRSAELQILDLQGRLVQRLALDRNGNDEAEISLDGHAPGLYIGILLVDGIPADRTRLLKAE